MKNKTVPQTLKLIINPSGFDTSDIRVGLTLLIFLRDMTKSMRCDHKSLLDTYENRVVWSCVRSRIDR